MKKYRASLSATKARKMSENPKNILETMYNGIKREASHGHAETEHAFYDQQAQAICSAARILEEDGYEVKVGAYIGGEYTFVTDLDALEGTIGDCRIKATW